MIHLNVNISFDLKVNITFDLKVIYICRHFELATRSKNHSRVIIIVTDSSPKRKTKPNDVRRSSPKKMATFSRTTFFLLFLCFDGNTLFVPSLLLCPLGDYYVPFSLFRVCLYPGRRVSSDSVEGLDVIRSSSSG